MIKKTVFAISSEYEGHSVTQGYRLRPVGTGANKVHKRVLVDMPTQIQKYTFGKVGVDNGDAMLRNQLAVGHLRTRRWTVKMFIYILSIARQNAFLTHVYYNPLKPADKDSFKPQWDFTAALIRTWLFQWKHRQQDTATTTTTPPPSSAQTHARVP